MSVRRRAPVWRALALSASALFGGAGLTACATESAPYEEAPGAFLWDQEWTCRSTHAEVSQESVVPFPTDTDLLETLYYGAGGAPPVSDVLEDVGLVFEIDGRVLVQPAGFDEPASSGTNYRIIDDRFIRLSVERSPWYQFSYQASGPGDTLLFTPADENGGILMGLVFEVIEMTLFEGDLESAPARVAGLLLGDPRVESETDRYLYDLVQGSLESVPIDGFDDVSAWLVRVLKETALVSSDVSEEELAPSVDPIVSALLAADQAGITDALVELILESDLPLEIAPARVASVLPFSQYRSMVEARGYWAQVRRVEMVLGR